MARSNDRMQISDAQIAVLAYERWMARGCPITDGADDWFAARNTLEAELTKPAPRVAPRKTTKRAIAAAS